MGVYCSKREVLDYQVQNFEPKKAVNKKEDYLIFRCPNTSANLDEYNSHSTKNSSDGKVKCTKVCFICHERVSDNHSCTNSMVKDLEKHMDKD